MINLLPADYKKAMRFAQINVTLARYIVLVLMTTVVIGGIMFFGVTAAENNRKNIERSLADDVATAASLEPVNEEAQALAEDIDLIAAILDREVRFSDLLQEIGAVIPSGVVLSDLTITEDKTEPLTLVVAAESEARIGVFLENLNDSELFAGGEISLIQRLNEPVSGYLFTGQIKAFFVTAPQPAAAGEAAP